jgi:glycosyltransferase involved in cell wall biosynthesis
VIRVLFVTTGLATGGAEKQLARLLANIKDRIDPAVVSLAPRGPVSAEIEALGVPVWHLDLASAVSLPRAALRLSLLSHRFRPVVLQGWMYHGNLAALFAAWCLNKRVPVVWGIRQSLYDLAREKPNTQRVIRLGARWSSRAAAIVYNAHLARTQHEAIGFAVERGRVIGNGFDGQAWQPDEEDRRSVRAKLGIAPDAPLIGLIARYHPMKGHEVFLDAAVRLAERDPKVHFLLAGRDVEPSHPVFQPYAQMGVLKERLHLLGERTDIPRLTAALDIASSSSSWGEGFSNTIAEALCCGVPVVATDVGDSREIVGDSGIIVPVGDFEALANAWQRLLDAGLEARRTMGERGRARVLERYSIKAMAEAYLQLYDEVSHRCTRKT